MNALIKKILITLLLVVVYRLATFVPIPFAGERLSKALVDQSAGILTILSGGGHSRLSIFSLGVTPYITASIVLQLLGTVYDSLKQIIQDKTRYNALLKKVSLVLSLFHASIFVYYNGMFAQGSIVHGITAIIAIVSATFFAVWLADRITKYGIGNGISVTIAAGVLSEFFYSYGTLMNLARVGEKNLLQIAAILMVVMSIVLIVVYVETAVRKVKVNYTRIFGAQQIKDQSYIPIKLNVAGVLPVIFSSTLMMFVEQMLSWYYGADMRSGYLYIIHLLCNAALIMVFTIFYASILIRSNEMAEQLKKNHGYIAGYRPGAQTAKYIENIALRLSYASAFYLFLISAIPEVFLWSLGVTLFVSGTSILICVTVIVEVISRIVAHRLSLGYATAR